MMALFKKLFPFLYKTEWHVKPEHEVKLAFVSDGIEYFCFVNGFDAYYERYMAGLDRMQEIEYRVDKKYLDDFQKFMREYLNKGDLVNASILLKNLEDRRAYVCNTELLYNLASVWFFDKSENCYTYNYEYAEEKIKRWKKDKSLLAFFLRTPLKDFLPSISHLKMSMEDLEKAVNLETLTALKYHLSNISETYSDKDQILKWQSQVKELEELAGRS